MVMIAIETIVAIVRGNQPPSTSGGLAKASRVLGTIGGARDGLYSAMRLSCLVSKRQTRTLK